MIALTPINITNTMSYSFDLFLLVLSFFYMYLFILMFFYNIPFSTKAESMYLNLHKDFYKTLISLHNDKKTHTLKYYNHKYKQIDEILDKMQLWAGMIDTKYFDKVDKKSIFQMISYMRYLSYISIYNKYQNKNIKTQFQENEIRYINQMLKAILNNKPIKYPSKDITSDYKLEIETIKKIAQIQFQMDINQLKESRF
jgi:hypothetical protein